MSIVQQARALLAELGFDAERSNERSAMVLLALLQLGGSSDWRDAANPMLGTRAIMDWIRDEMGVAYAANTRETVRRFTLHQFVEAALVEENADQPDRPVNSPRWNYRVSGTALAAIQTYGSDGWEVARDSYLEAQPGLMEVYAAKRVLERIPVTFNGGSEVRLSPGGQNVLIRSMIEEFCPRFIAGGEVVYVGDADEKWAHHDVDIFFELGLNFDQHGKMPDLVVYARDRNWLFLMEACSSHGPVDAQRKGELRRLFEKSTAGLVYVSCFPTRVIMRKYLADLAWETEAWTADAPDHMVHFNGGRFLGPYEC